MQISLAASMLLLVLMPAQTQPGAAPAPAQELIELDVVAVDGRGNPVTDLRPEEIEVWLERYRIPVESLTALTDIDERRRRSVTLVLDDMTLAPDVVPRVKQIARRFVTGLETGDRLAIVTLSGGGVKSTGDRAALLRAVDAYGVRATMPLRPDDLAARVLGILTSLAHDAAETPGHRRTVVAVGPAWVFDTPLPPPGVGRNLRDEWTAAMRAMAVANVVLYAVDPGGVGSAPVTSGSSGLASDTGGHAFVNTNDPEGVADRIMREAASYYIVTFKDPPFFRNAPLRKLEVRVRRPDVTVRARRLIPGTHHLTSK